MSEDVIVRMRDIRGAKICSRGARGFFLRHGLDWGRFLTDGVPASELLATGDAQAAKVVEVARGRQK